MERETWSDLAIFAAIVEAGGFTKAAGRLGVSQSALSHAMRAMEARLGVRLLARTTRSVAPTAAGEALMTRLRPAMAEIATAVDRLNADRERPAGRVRITAHRTAALQVVMPRLARFAEDYPDISVELAIEDGLVDIVAGRFDGGVRHEQMLDQDMTGIRIGGPYRVAIVGAPAYFARRPAPATPHDIIGHRCLVYRLTSSGAIYRWRFEKDGAGFVVDVPQSFVSNDVDVLLKAALDGLGIACASEPQVERHLASGALVRVLADWSPAIPPNYLYYPSRRHVSAAFRAFIDAMRSPLLA